VLIEDTCQTQLMLETAVSHGQQGASAEYIGFSFNTNKVHYFKMISLCLAIAVCDASLYISVFFKKQIGPVLYFGACLVCSN